MPTRKAHSPKFYLSVILHVVLVCCIGATGEAQSSSSSLTTIDFENVSGPSLFGSISPPLMLSSATFSGGEVLTNATYLPADPTSVYGTAFFCSGCLPEITIDFSEKVSNFSMLLLNGETFTVTYTIEDDAGGTTQVSLVANSSGGSATVSLPETNIRQVVVSGDTDAFDFLIDNVQFSPSKVALIDPVDSQFLTEYADGASISTDTDVLADGGTLVQGASADGVTQVLIRIPAAKSGDAYTLSLQDENGSSGDVTANGGLFQIGDAPANAAATLSVSAVDTSMGPMAFAVYLAPSTFSRGVSDDSAAMRTITLQLQGASQGMSTISIQRPPVMLVHGLWDSQATWANFTPLSADPANRFYIGKPDYSGLVSGITATSPNYSSVNKAKIRANSLGFFYNAPNVEKSIRSYIAAYKAAYNVAAVQADVVGHSMGGDISRAVAEVADFSRSDTYGKGLIDKLITVGTPHLGSPLAIDLLSPASSCASGVLARFAQPSFTTVTIGGTSENGAVGDLQGTGDGSNLSDALTSLQGSKPPFPIAYVAATSNSSNLANLGKSVFSASYFLRSLWCPKTDVIAQALTPTGWPTLFSGASNDSVVPLTSELGNVASTGAGGTFDGVIHSGGLGKLDFIPPAELDSASMIANEVINLLNEPKSGQDFFGGSR